MLKDSYSKNGLDRIEVLRELPLDSADDVKFTPVKSLF